MANFTKGQRVRFHNGSRYSGQFGTVEKALPKNVDVLTDAGLRVRANPYYLTTDLAAPPATAYAEAVAAVPPPVGTVVRVNDERTPGYYVVIGDGMLRGHVVAKVARLGGENGRYWKMPVSRLTTVALEELELGVEV